MSPISTTSTVTESATAPTPATLKLRAQAQPETEAYPELANKGYTVVKGVLSPEKAQHYVDEMYKYLESFGKGFKGDDRSTWHVENVPIFDKGGMYRRYGVAHEQFAWDIRTEPAVVDVFAKIWGTHELLVSYDVVNITLPYASELSAAAAKPWPHVDQSPNKRFKNCVQGIVNLYPNGPEDGGLMVLEGSMPLFDEYFETHEEIKPEDGWPTKDWWGHNEDALKWFYDRGCAWKKVEAAPGDVILWDSRTIHYGDAARGTEPRVATYVCFKPAKDISPEKLKERQECFAKSWGTSHDPVEFRVVAAHTEKWQLEEGERVTPRAPPVLNHRAQQLAGLVPY